MQRREFITLLGGAAVAWPITARAQQSAMPVIGFVNVASAKSFARPLSAFLKGLGEIGYVDGQNVVIEYRWAEGGNDRLPSFVADLIQRKVNVIAATSTPAAICEDAIEFTFGAGMGGNVTGATQATVEVAPKQLQMLHELVPTASADDPVRLGLVASLNRPAAFPWNDRYGPVAATPVMSGLHHRYVRI